MGWVFGSFIAFQSLEVLYVDSPGVSFNLSNYYWSRRFPALSWLCLQTSLKSFANRDRSAPRNPSNRALPGNSRANHSYEPYKGREDYENHIHDLFKRFRGDVTNLSWERSGEVHIISIHKPKVERLESSSSNSSNESEAESLDESDAESSDERAVESSDSSSESELEEGDCIRTPTSPNYYRGVWRSQQGKTIEPLPSSVSDIRALLNTRRLRKLYHIRVRQRYAPWYNPTPEELSDTGSDDDDGNDSDIEEVYGSKSHKAALDAESDETQSIKDEPEWWSE